MALAAEKKQLISDVDGWIKFRLSGRAGGSSDVVALAVEKQISSDLMSGGKSDLVAGLDRSQI